MYKKTIFAVSIIFASLVYTSNLQAQDCILGEIKMANTDYAFKNWAKCDGSSLAIESNQNLYEVIGTTYGGDATSFNLPNLNGKVPIGAGQGPGLTDRKLGGEIGTAKVTMTKDNLSAISIPTYDLNADEDDHAFEHGSNSAISVGNQQNATISKSIGGKNDPIDIRQPCLGVMYMICVDGLRPY